MKLFRLACFGLIAVGLSTSNHSKCLKDNTPGCNMWDTNPGCCSRFCNRGLCEDGCWGKIEGDRCEANFKCCEGFVCVDNKCTKHAPQPTPKPTPAPKPTPSPKPTPKPTPPKPTPKPSPPSPGPPVPSGWEVPPSCTFTLTLNRSYGDNYQIKVAGMKGDSFAAAECSSKGCDSNGFCADQCIKDGFGKGINAIKNQRGEVVAYGNCCNEKNAVVATSDCKGSGEGIGDCSGCSYTTASADHDGLTIDKCVAWFTKGCPNNQWPGAPQQPPRCGAGSNAIGVAPNSSYCRIYSCPSVPRLNGATGWHCYYKLPNATITIV